MSRKGGGLQWDSRLAPGGIGSPRQSRQGVPRWLIVAGVLAVLLLLMFYLARRGDDTETGASAPDNVAEAVRLAENRAGFSTIELEVVDGRVTLTGDLETLQERFAAEKVAYSVPGVIAVDNQIAAEEQQTIDQLPEAAAGPADLELQIALVRTAAANPIIFASSSADIESGSLAVLDNIAALIIEAPGVSIRIEGHTDSDGEEDANRQLSQSRATAVLGELVSRGVESERLEAIGLGESVPIGSNETKDGKAANRRIEFVVVVE